MLRVFPSQHPAGASIPASALPGMLRPLPPRPVSRGLYDDTVLAGYERRWQEDFGRELELGYRLFEMRQKMSAEDIDALLQALNTPSILRTIEEHGDMDRPGALDKKTAGEPFDPPARKTASPGRPAFPVLTGSYWGVGNLQRIRVRI